MTAALWGWCWSHTPVSFGFCCTLFVAVFCILTFVFKRSVTHHNRPRCVFCNWLPQPVVSTWYCDFVPLVLLNWHCWTLLFHKFIILLCHSQGVSLCSCSMSAPVKAALLLFIITHFSCGRMVYAMLNKTHLSKLFSFSSFCFYFSLNRRKVRGIGFIIHDNRCQYCIMSMTEGKTAACASKIQHP